jgi:hypothetical protein
VVEREVGRGIVHRVAFQMQRSFFAPRRRGGAKFSGRIFGKSRIARAREPVPSPAAQARSGAASAAAKGSLTIPGQGRRVFSDYRMQTKHG